MYMACTRKEAKNSLPFITDRSKRRNTPFTANNNNREEKHNLPN
jgi:hypothetical protein